MVGISLYSIVEMVQQSITNFRETQTRLLISSFDMEKAHSETEKWISLVLKITGTS
jgi:hypothetical protein